MPFGININPMANFAARSLGNHFHSLETSTRRLSSGLRITRSADDAAGMAVSTLMRASVTSFNQGMRNANDAISLVQTADGALSVIDEKLIRMKELAMQASTGTYNSDQRLIIDSEYQAMASEITRIALATDFNGIYLLNGNLSGTHNGAALGSTGQLKVHFGAGNDSSEDYYYIQIGNVTASALGFSATNSTSSISTQALAQSALDVVQQAIISKDKIRASLGAFQGRLENTIDVLGIQVENMKASESRISDVDVAVEMTKFVRTQIMSQAAVSMLAQANTLPRMAMSLIQ